MIDYRILATAAVAGLSATAPMTVAMQVMKEHLPEREQFPLPPRLITERLVNASDAGAAVDSEPERVALTLASHYAYGAAVGALFGLVESKRETNRSIGRAAIRGIGWGLAVWSGSYLGWLPAAGILPPATQESKERNALMITAHVIWGASLGAFSAALLRAEDDSFSRRARPFTVLN